MLVACVALLLAGVVAVIADRGGGDGADLAADASPLTTSEVTTATSEAAGSGTGETGEIQPSTTAPAAATADPDAGSTDDGSTGSTDDSAAETATTTTTAATTTNPTSTTSTPAGSALTSPAPTPAGTYRYDTDGTMTLGTTERKLPPVTTLTVDEVDGEGRQLQVRDMRDENGDGTITRTTFRLDGEGTYLEQIELESSFSGLGQTAVLTATSPFLLVPADAAEGTTTTGRLEGDGIVADITFTIKRAGPETSDTHLLVELSGDVEGTQTSDLVVRSSDRLTVSEDVDSDVRSGGFRVTSRYTATLQG